MFLLPAPDPNEPLLHIGRPLVNEDAYRRQLMADVIAVAEPSPEDYDIELATELLLDYAKAHDGEYTPYRISMILSESGVVGYELIRFINGWDAAVSLMQR